MKSKVLESWVGKQVVVDKREGEYRGELVEFGSCWVVLRGWGVYSQDNAGEILIRLGGNDTIELAAGQQK